MASESFNALMLVATLRSKGGVFCDGGPEILDQLDGVERTSVVRRQRELIEMLTGPEAWPALVGLETGVAGGPLAPFGRRRRDGPPR